MINEGTEPMEVSWIRGTFCRTSVEHSPHLRQWSRESAYHVHFDATNSWVTSPSRYSVIRNEKKWPVVSDFMSFLTAEVLTPYVYGAFRPVTLRFKLVFFSFRRSGDCGWCTGTRSCYHLACGRGNPLLEEEKDIATIQIGLQWIYLISISR